jgi:hypothetical protein
MGSTSDRADAANYGASARVDASRYRERIRRLSSSRRPRSPPVIPAERSESGDHDPEGAPHSARGPESSEQPCAPHRVQDNAFQVPFSQPSPSVRAGHGYCRNLQASRLSNEISPRTRGGSRTVRITSWRSRQRWRCHLRCSCLRRCWPRSCRRRMAGSCRLGRAVRHHHRAARHCRGAHHHWADLLKAARRGLRRRFPDG